MCYGWWEESVRQERIRLAKEETDKPKRSAQPPASPQGLDQKPETKPSPQTQPEAVPV